MRPTRRALAGILAGLAVVLAGCGESPTSPSSTLTQQRADDVAQQIGASLAQSNGGAMAELDAARTRAVSASGSFSTASAETTFSSGGVSYFLAVTFFDAAGNELPGWDPTAVRMVVVTRATGSFSHPEYSADVAHAALLDVLGIEEASDRLTLDGVARDTLHSEFTPADSSDIRTLDAESAAAWEDVVALKDKEVNPWPLSGRLVWHAVVDAQYPHQGQQISAHYEVTALVVFNGTRYPTIVIDGKYSYRVDLETGAVERV